MIRQLILVLANDPIDPDRSKNLAKYSMNSVLFYNVYQVKANFVENLEADFALSYPKISDKSPIVYHVWLIKKFRLILKQRANKNQR